MEGNPRIGSKVLIISTGERGKITGHATTRDKRKIFFIEFEKPGKDGFKGAQAWATDVRVV